MSVQALARKIRRFFKSEYFTDALLITFAVVLPVVILYYFNYPQAAVTVGLGALNVALTNSAGTATDKRFSILVSIPAAFIISFTVAASWPFTGWMALIFVALIFSSSMLTVYGLRFSMLGTSFIGLAIFTWGLKPPAPLAFALYVMAGNIWFYLVNLLSIRLWPLRSLRNAVTECLEATADFLEAKAPFYNVKTPLNDSYRKLLELHVRVNQKQELVRHLVIRDRQVLGSLNERNQIWISITATAIDLYDQITAIHFDYELVREHFRLNGVLELITQVIKLQANELHRIADDLHRRKAPALNVNYSEELEHLASRLKYIIDRETPVHADMLQQLKLNIEQIDDHLQAIKTGMFTPDVSIKYEDFAPALNFSLSQLKQNFTLRSPVFRFAMRLTIACLMAFCLSALFSLGKYSYWVMLTVLVIIKPSFNVTYQRNKQRLIGSLTGIGIGFSLMWLFPVTSLQLALGVIFLLGFFSFGRTRYLTAVICITAMVVLCLNVYTGQNSHIVIERIYDTLIGCLISFGASYLLPVWEGRKLKFYMGEVMQANISYLKALRDRLNGNTLDINSYKLSRKAVYVNLANLAAAFTAMQTEPGRKAINEDNVYRFQVLSYNLSSVITSLFSSAKHSIAQQQYTGQISLINQSIELMQEASEGLNSNGTSMQLPSHGNSDESTITSAAGAQLLYSISRQLAIVINT
ncbi:FUSC family membrane protein [Mucilaginibacter sp. CSA2-8R]|uniref:FUSC family membrane protein n=1 Tax=Mucilaginibacter sp. CSA2-8R TaxID=3141542 RepID=UPI00315CB195